MLPEKIESQSYSIIRELLPNTFGGEDEYEIAVRVAHSTADIELAKTLVFHKDFINSAEKTLKMKLPILTDTEMAKTAIERYANQIGISVICKIHDQEVIELAKKEGITRAMASVRTVAKNTQIGLAICGNSPTFLQEIINIQEKEKEGYRIPYALIALPVGFVHAEEVKRQIAGGKAKIPFITNISPKGGTPPAVAVAIYLINKVKKEMEIPKRYGEHS